MIDVTNLTPKEKQARLDNIQRIENVFESRMKSLNIKDKYFR